MITVKEYAANKGVSERAVYKQLKTHEKELEGHIEKIQGKKWLDDEAVRILDEASKNNAVVVVEDSRNERIAELEAENEQLKTGMMALQERLTEEILRRDARIEVLTDKVLLLTEKTEEKKKKWWFW